jgi:hypothetical protein
MMGLMQEFEHANTVSHRKRKGISCINNGLPTSISSEISNGVQHIVNVVAIVKQIIVTRTVTLALLVVISFAESCVFATGLT